MPGMIDFGFFHFQYPTKILIMKKPFIAILPLIVLITSCASQRLSNAGLPYPLEDPNIQYYFPDNNLTASNSKAIYTVFTEKKAIRNIRLYSYLDQSNKKITEKWYVYNNNSSKSIKIKVLYTSENYQDAKSIKTYTIRPGQNKMLHIKRKGHGKITYARLLNASYKH